MKLLLPCVLAAGLIATSVAAQTAPCFALNDNNSGTNVITGSSAAGPGEWGYLVKIPKPMLIESMRIYTGNTYKDSYMKLAVHENNATTQLPGKLLGEGTWKNPKPTPSDWFGTNFDQPIFLAKDQEVWVVWTEPGWSTPPLDPTGNTLVATIVRSGTTPWRTVSNAAFKCRMYCNKLDARSVTPFGPACRGATTGVGTSFTNTPPAVGNQAFRIEGTGLPANATTFLAFGLRANFPSLSLGPLAPGCALNTDFATVFAGPKTGTGDVRSTTGAKGHVQYDLPIPNNPALKNVFFATQIAVADATARHALPLVFTNAMRIKVF